MNKNNFLALNNAVSGKNPMSFDMYADFEMLKTEQQFEHWVYKKLANMGFTDVIVAFLPYVDPTTGKHFSNFRDDWVGHYLENNFVEHDPVVYHCINYNTPVFWQQSFDRKKFSKGTNKLFSDSDDFGLIQGVAITVPLKCGKGTISIHFDGNEKEFLKVYQDKCFELLGLTQAIHYKLAHDYPNKLFDPPELPARQLECLKYLAHGFTNVEIARFMKISHYTVRGLVSDIIRNLNASNRTEATMLAIKGGLI